ncbi:MAG: hypothetical protein ACK2UK_10705 [Candidatus Promineifilaceae bacterium]
MFKLDGASLFRAGAMGAAAAGLLYLMALTPFFNGVLLVLLLIGIVLIPLFSGMYYGKLAPGEETMLQSIVGGGITGVIIGLILGLAFGLNEFVMSTATTFMGSVASGIGTSILVGGVFAAAGAILGALGGVIWKMVQKPEQTVEGQ